MLGGAFDRFDVCRIVCFLSNTHLPQSTPRPILPTWRNERYVHVSGKVQQMCSSRTAMGSVPGSLLSPSACFLVLCASYRRRAPVLDFATLFLVLYSPVLRYLVFLVPWYFVPFFPYTHITSIAIVYSRFTSIAIYEVPKETSHVQL